MGNKFLFQIQFNGLQFKNLFCFILFCLLCLILLSAGNCKYEVLPGEWYGPGTSCYVVRDLVQAHEYRQLQQWATAAAAAATKGTTTKDTKLPRRVFRVHVVSQGAVYKDTIEDLMTREHRARLERKKKQQPPAPLPEHPLAIDDDNNNINIDHDLKNDGSQWDTALLLLIPLRLGLKGVNEDYAKSIAHMFSFPQSVGMLGGRPRGARWYVAFDSFSDFSSILCYFERCLYTFHCY